jgi:predicted acyltransferase
MTTNTTANATTTTETSPGTPAGSRAEAFKAEVKALKIKDPNAAREQLWLRTGLVAMLAGVVVSLVGYFVSHGTSDPLEQNDALTIAIIGVSVTILGGALFLRYSFASFMRFWLARFLFEQQRDRD